MRMKGVVRTIRNVLRWDDGIRTSKRINELSVNVCEVERGNDSVLSGGDDKRKV